MIIFNTFINIAAYSNEAIASIYPSVSPGEGATVNLSCTVVDLFNVNVTSVTWTRINYGLGYEVGFGKSLVLESVSRNDTGQYYCIVFLSAFTKNIDELKSNVLHLDIIGKFSYIFLVDKKLQKEPYRVVVKLIYSSCLHFP